MSSNNSASVPREDRFSSKLDGDYVMTAELETCTLVVPEPTREDESGSLLSRPKMG
jgi:hypothetical protein